MDGITKKIESEVEAVRQREREKLFTADKTENKQQEAEFTYACCQRAEQGDAELYACHFRGRFLYVCEWGVFLRWAGHHWQEDIEQLALAAVSDIADIYDAENWRLLVEQKKAEAESDEGAAALINRKRKELRAKARKLRTEKGRQACLKFVATIPHMFVKAEQLDYKPYFLAFNNGVVDLKTGKFSSGRQEDFLLKAVPHEWQGLNTPAIQWYKFLLRTFDRNKEMVRFLQRLLGLGIIGKVIEHLFIIFFGAGRNGKDIIQAAVVHALGPLAGVIQAAMLMNTGVKNASAPSPEIMSLQGRRLVFASESAEDGSFSVNNIKLFTGGGMLTGRRPHDRQETSFLPAHTLFLHTNHKARASAHDFAFWARAIEIDFPLSFVDDPKAPNERKADKHLLEKLLPEAAGILAWMVRGCLMYQQTGLQVPVSVRESTEQYRREEDRLADFLEACTLPDETAEVAGPDLYAVFEEWHSKNVSKRVPTTHKFNKLLSLKHSKFKRGGNIYFSGLRLS